MKWIKKDDNVIVISGNYKGRTGSVLARKKDKVIVKGVNVRKKHIKRRSKKESSRTVYVEMAIHISNVALLDSSNNRIKPKVKVENGVKKLVYFDKDGKEIVYRQISKKR